MLRISASKARVHFAEILNRVAFGREHVIVHRNEKDIGVFLSVKEFEGLKKLADQMEDQLDVESGLKALEIRESMSLDEL